MILCFKPACQTTAGCQCNQFRIPTAMPVHAATAVASTDDLDGLVEMLKKPVRIVGVSSEDATEIYDDLRVDASAAIIRLREDIASARSDLDRYRKWWGSIYPVALDCVTHVATSDPEQIGYDLGVAFNMLNNALHAREKQYTEADDARVAVDAELAKARDALRPFADEADKRSNLVLGPDIDHWSIGGNALTLGDLRRARAIMEKPDA